MTFDEFKRDAKEQDGDPHAKSRRKQLHRTFVRGGIARTSEASFVVVNPTHVAIALRYAPPHVPVPEILVRGSPMARARVRAIAERARIPFVEDVALARGSVALRRSRPADSGRSRSWPSPTAIAAALIRAGCTSAA